MSFDLFTNPSGTREEILAATYRALQHHGYADLTIKTIGEEFEKSPSLVYRHYDGKDDLVLECLEYILEEFEQRLTATALEDPRAELERFLDGALALDQSQLTRLTRTLVELRAQAVHDDAYRDHFSRSDQLFEDRLANIVRAGKESGAFRECDPNRVGAFCFTAIAGAFFRWVTTIEEGDADGYGADDPPEWHRATRAELEAYLERRVYRD